MLMKLLLFKKRMRKLQKKPPLKLKKRESRSRKKERRLQRLPRRLRRKRMLQEL